MCPCPFCATVAGLIALLFPFKKTREWLQRKMKRHHHTCDMCQHGAHAPTDSDRTGAGHTSGSTTHHRKKQARKQ